MHACGTGAIRKVDDADTSSIKPATQQQQQQQEKTTIEESAYACMWCRRHHECQ
jgi:hypothetical protein